MRKIRILEVAAEYGAGTRGAALGMKAIRYAALQRKYKYFDRYPIFSIENENFEKLKKEQTYRSAKRGNVILEVWENVLQRVKEFTLKGEFLLIISGDHSNAGGTIAGLRAAYPEKQLGVIWIDAHGDLHTPYSSPSGNMHGMPIAAALNLTNEQMARRKPRAGTVSLWNKFRNLGGISPKINPQDLVFIGIRDLEEEEWNVIHSKNILHFSPQVLLKEGVDKVVSKTTAHLAHCDIIYLSFDIDSLEAALVPGTGTPVPDGLSKGQAAALLKAFWKHPKLAALEFTEINPLLDHKNRTATIAADLLHSLLEEE